MSPRNAARPAPAVAGNGPRKFDQAGHQITPENTTNAASQQEAMRTILLAQLRITLVELRLVETEVEFIGCALRNRLVTPHQAMQMAYERDVMDWLFRDREGGA